MPISFQQPGPISPATSFGAGVAQEFGQLAPQTNQLAMQQQAEQLKRAQLQQQAAESQQFLQQRQQQIDQQDPMQQMPLSQAENMQLQQLQNGLAQAHANPDLGPDDLQQIQQQVMPRIQNLQKRQRMGQQQQQQQQQATVEQQFGQLADLSQKHTQAARQAGIIGPQDTLIAEYGAHGQPQFKHVASKADPMEHYKLQAETQQHLAEFKAEQQAKAADLKIQAVKDQMEAKQNQAEQKDTETANIMKEAAELFKHHTVSESVVGEDGKTKTTTKHGITHEEAIRAVIKGRKSVRDAREAGWNMPEPMDPNEIKKHVGAPVATRTAAEESQRVQEQQTLAGQQQLGSEWQHWKSIMGVGSQQPPPPARPVPTEQLAEGD